MDINIAASKNIRQIRLQRKLTLDAAAKITGVSRSMLAQIEKGEVNPTLSVLWKIANGYKVSFSSLIEQSEEQATLLPLSDIIPIMDDNGRYINYPAFQFDDRRLFETYRIVIAPDGGLQSEAHLAGTEEYVTVFGGTVEIIAGGKTYSLSEGDSIRFKADTPHSYRNIGDKEVLLSMLIYYSK